MVQVVVIVTAEQKKYVHEKVRRRVDRASEDDVVVRSTLFLQTESVVERPKRSIPAENRHPDPILVPALQREVFVAKAESAVS
jgi:hypothetical protein